MGRSQADSHATPISANPAEENPANERTVRLNNQHLFPWKANPCWTENQRCLNHLCIKNSRIPSAVFSFHIYPLQSRPARSTALPVFRSAGHLISRTVHSVSVPSSSKMRRLHSGLGHLITSICHRLPALIWNKGTSLPLPVPFYRLCFIGNPTYPENPKTAYSPDSPSDSRHHTVSA